MIYLISANSTPELYARFGVEAESELLDYLMLSAAAVHVRLDGALVHIGPILEAVPAVQVLAFDAGLAEFGSGLIYLVQATCTPEMLAKFGPEVESGFLDHLIEKAAEAGVEMHGVLVHIGPVEAAAPAVQVLGYDTGLFELNLD